MNCQEVMELMQRDMDGDLNHQEKLFMNDHVNQCSDCAAMLVRLQKLSNELEQLPRVVPKFSLVDAILPELDRLQASDSANSVQEAPSDKGSSTSTRSTSRSNRSNRHLLGKVSGVVAAGIIAGVLLFSNPSEWSLGRSGSSNYDAAAPSPMTAASPESSLLMSKQAVDDKSDYEAGAEPNADARIRSMDVSDQAGVAAPAEPAAPAAPDSGKQSQEVGDIAIKPKEDLGNNNMMGISGFEEAPAPENNPSIVNGQAPNSSAAIPAVLSESPDGKWRVIAVQGTGQFEVHTAADDSLVYTSQPRDGSISLLEWNEDSTVLFFTITEADGKQTQWQFNTVTSQETLR